MAAQSSNFWLIRHALVEENARATLYGVLDVEICPHTLAAQQADYAALAKALPQHAVWYVTPLSRTRRTAEAILQAGYGATPLAVEPGLIEQDLGAFQGTPHAELPNRLAQPAHPFWPLSGTERPPGGESMQDVITRVGAAMERLALLHRDRDIVIVSHGGAIRAAIAHALGIEADRALHLSVENISLSRLQRQGAGWRVISVNTHPG